LPDEAVYPASVDVMPCMSIKTEDGVIILTNDDYTVIRKMLDAWFVDGIEPYDALLLTIRHIRNAYSRIFDSFKNSKTTLNTYDPFELLFSKEQAIKLLILAEEKAKEIIDADGQAGGSKIEDAKRVLELIFHLKNIFKHVPGIPEEEKIDLPDTAPVSQILPDGMFSLQAHPLFMFSGASNPIASIDRSA
jgi:hypothetical protein